MNRLVKVCGLRDPENIRAVFGLKPDLAGLIFHPASPRYVSNPESLEFINQLTDKPLIAGVFVDPSYREVEAIAKVLSLSAIQLHGSETPGFCRDIRSMGFRVIKAFGIGSGFEFTKLEAYEGSADYFLFDTPDVRGGGTGRKFDWALLAEYRGSTPWFLSGGITPSTGVFPDHPLMAGVDLNSRFETAPGIKDTGLLSLFINTFRNR